MINLILKLLEKIPYRTKFGLNLADLLKQYYFIKRGQYQKPLRCYCGGIIEQYGIGEEGWILECQSCFYVYDED